MAKGKNGKVENFEKMLFKEADKFRKNIDAAEYKHIALGDEAAKSKDILGGSMNTLPWRVCQCQGQKGRPVLSLPDQSFARWPK